ncbi:HAMP domain-containing protein [Clostridium sp. D2Q-11]|uniref:histidine kinase n=1 Tax=Anaeromonas frigoriresistens TaxID=2683708 RepID=A0A942UPV4_9FIRM|nr:ATP-binding protein [Anaeromonas frigoriresistens]MBS4537089.1 HAMP domain-containing protein [Anaeromonas frigoriresistens]
MTKSIRYKLFGVFILLLSLFLMIFILSSYFLDDIFISGNKRIIKRNYNEFNTTLREGEVTQQELVDMVDEIGGNITILTPNLNLKVTTSTFNNEDNTAFNLQVMKEIEKLRIDETKTFTFVIASSLRDDRRVMFFIGKLSTGGFFIAEKPLKVIESSIEIAELFIIIAGIGTLIIGSIIVYFLSTKLSKPIVEVNRVANEIANLNFDEKVEVKSEDEIGRLGNSINLISNKLNTVLTELTLANSKLREDIEKEKQLEKMRRKFVSNVSHELKTPISMIQGYAEGLKFNIAKTPEDKEYYYNVIIEESDKMSNLIDDLLKLSSYESGNFHIDKDSFDISSLLKDVIEKYKINIKERNMKLDLELPESLIINADSLRIEQIISNFMNNTLKYGEEGGNIKISLKDLKDYFRLSFYNSGDKIDQKELENIWTSFYKADSEKKSIQTGTGLGLAIVRAIVELHGGRYGAMNKEDGVEFWITLPKS